MCVCVCVYVVCVHVPSMVRHVRACVCNVRTCEREHVRTCACVRVCVHAYVACVRVYVCMCVCAQCGSLLQIRGAVFLRLFGAPSDMKTMNTEFTSQQELFQKN